MKVTFGFDLSAIDLLSLVLTVPECHLPLPKGLRDHTTHRSSQASNPIQSLSIALRLTYQNRIEYFKQSATCIRIDSINMPCV